MRWAEERLRSEEGREAERRHSRESQKKQKAKAAGPAPSNGLEDKGSEEEPHAGAPGRGVVEEGLARLDVLEYRARVPVGFGPNGGAECAANGEVPGLGLSRGVRHEYEYCDVCVNRSDDNMLDVGFQESQLTSDPTTTPQQCNKRRSTTLPIELISDQRDVSVAG